MFYLLLTFVLSQAASQQSTAPRITVERASTENITAAHPVVEFDIVNNTGATITAWKVGVNVRRSDGSIDQVTTSTDAYVEFAGLVPDTGAVGYPHSRIRGRLTIDRASPEIRDITAVLLCAIFADSTWIGDSKDVDALFARREVHYRALSEIVTELREVRQSSSGTSALNEALRRLNKPNQDEAVSALKERMRGNVQAALRASDKPGRSSDELLTQWILQNQARLEATEVHRHKGPQAVLK